MRRVGRLNAWEELAVILARWARAAHERPETAAAWHAVHCGIAVVSLLLALGEVLYHAVAAYDDARGARRRPAHLDDLAAR